MDLVYLVSLDMIQGLIYPIVNETTPARFNRGNWKNQLIPGSQLNPIINLDN